MPALRSKSSVPPDSCLSSKPSCTVIQVVFFQSSSDSRGPPSILLREHAPSFLFITLPFGTSPYSSKACITYGVMLCITYKGLEPKGTWYPNSRWCIHTQACQLNVWTNQGQLFSLHHPSQASRLAARTTQTGWLAGPKPFTSHWPAGQTSWNRPPSQTGWNQNCERDTGATIYSNTMNTFACSNSFAASSNTLPRIWILLCVFQYFCRAFE